MKPQFRIPKFLSLTMLCAVLVLAIGNALDAFHTPGGGLGMASLIFVKSLFSANMGGSGHLAGIQVEVWNKHIEENLYANNEFLLSMEDLSEYVEFKTCHLPQAGGDPNVVKNRSKGGAAVNTNLRTDTILDFSIDEYTTDPFLITNAEEVELSYDKMSSVLYSHEMQLRKVIAGNILVDIAPTGTATLSGGATNANLLRSTGVVNNDPADVKSAPSYLTGTTGNRLKFTLYDIKAACALFDTQDIPEEDRFMIMSAQAKQQIIDDLMATKYRGEVGDVFDTATGRIDKLLGFKIYVRSSVCRYDNTAGTPVVRAFGSVAAGDDNDAILFWHKAFVAKAIGDIHVYETPNSAIHYGDVYSALVRMGASKKRTSELGVGAIVQTAAA